MSGRKLELILIQFDMSKKFSEKVPEESVIPLLDKNGKRMSTTDDESLNYSPEQVDMMACLRSLCVRHSWFGLKGHDGKVKFEGVSDFFGKKINK
jgi:hypothetical protein